MIIRSQIDVVGEVKGTDDNSVDIIPVAIPLKCTIKVEVLK